MNSLKKVRIVGAGLLGTSLGLALKSQGVVVDFSDLNPTHLALARDLVGFTSSSQSELSPELVVIATPSAAFREIIREEFRLNPQAIFIDLASTKTESILEVEMITDLAPLFCGTHPMAGRENGGPHGARSDLFLGRPWVLSPTSTTQQDVLSYVEDLVRSLGAIPIMMSAPEHDRAGALISHLPQLTSSLLAKQLSGGPETWLALSGQGLRDTTRIAASDPHLWTGIIFENREQLRPLLVGLRGDLDALIAGLDQPGVTETLLKDGRHGRSMIPGKHGGKSREYTYLPIVIEDQAGQLASLFNECAKILVNVEDLTIEHSPGQFTGLITLALSKKDAELLSQHLLASGWNVHAPRQGQ